MTFLRHLKELVYSALALFIFLYIVKNFYMYELVLVIYSCLSYFLVYLIQKSAKDYSLMGFVCSPFFLIYLALGAFLDTIAKKLYIKFNK